MENKVGSTERFTGLAETYAKARPGYSDDAIEFIVSHSQLKPGRVLIDIGSGTGISSRIFAKRGLKVIGIEPNADMRAQAQLANGQLESSSIMLPVYQEGTAEHTRLADHSADVVIAAQAFHWFVADKALPEFVRILKPDGWVVLLWNLRSETDPFTLSYGDVMRKCDQAYAETETNKLTAGNELLNSNLFVKKEKFVFKNEQIMDEETLYQRATSVSYFPKDPQSGKVILQQLKDVYAQYQNNGMVRLQYDLEVYLGQR